MPFIPDSEIGVTKNTKGALGDISKFVPDEVQVDMNVVAPKKATDVVTSIFPGGKVGEAIGTLGGYIVSPNKKEYDLSAPGVKEVVGDVVKGASSVAGLKLPVAGSVLGNIAQFGVLSAISGAGETASEGGGVKDIATNAFKSGLTGAAIGGVLGVVEKGIKALTDKTPKALYNNALKISQKLKSAGKSPSKFLLNEGEWGSLGSMLKAAKEGMGVEKAAIAQKVSKVPGGATFGEIRNDAVKLFQKELGNLYPKADIEAMVDKVPLDKLKAGGIISWKDVNSVREDLGTLIGDSKWLMSNPSENVKASQFVYRALASKIQKVSGTYDEFARYSQWIRTNKEITKAIDKADSKFGLGLYDIASGIGGATLGGIQGDSVGEKVKNATIGGLIGVSAERAINSPALKTGVAQLLNKLGSIPTDTAGKVSKTVITQLITELFGNQSDESTK